MNLEHRTPNPEPEPEHELSTENREAWTTPFHSHDARVAAPRFERPPPSPHRRRRQFDGLEVRPI